MALYFFYSEMNSEIQKYGSGCGIENTVTNKVISIKYKIGYNYNFEVIFETSIAFLSIASFVIRLDYIVAFWKSKEILTSIDANVQLLTFIITIVLNTSYE